MKHTSAHAPEGAGKEISHSACTATPTAAPTAEQPAAPHRVPKEELDSRLTALRAALTASDPAWRMAILNHKVTLYYFTGTMQEGVLVVTPDSATLWVRRDLTRAQEESQFADIRPMRSFRTLGEAYPVPSAAVYLEKKTATLEWVDMLKKYLPFEEIKPIGGIVNALRAQKSAYEIGQMRRAGEMHAVVLQQFAPQLCREGVSESVLAGIIYTELLRRGSMGISRYNQPLGEDVVGFVSFSENALRTTAFDGPGGTAGTCAAVQSIGSVTRTLRKNDLVYIDLPAGCEGYHTDKSIVFHVGALEDDPNAALIRAAYDCCIRLEKEAAALLVPGAVPEEIYFKILEQVDPQFADGFMHGGKFIGHSIGLTMDEPPVLAKGFRDPIRAGMTFAVEPKIALPGIGIVGTENTYLVVENGLAQPLTGGPQPLIEIV